MVSSAVLACRCPEYFAPSGKPLCLCWRDLCINLLVQAQSKDWVGLQEIPGSSLGCQVRHDALCLPKVPVAFHQVDPQGSLLALLGLFGFLRSLLHSPTILFL